MVKQLIVNDDQKESKTSVYICMDSNVSLTRNDKSYKQHRWLSMLKKSIKPQNGTLLDDNQGYCPFLLWLETTSEKMTQRVQIFATNSNNQNSIPGIHVLEGEDKSLQAAFCLPHAQPSTHVIPHPKKYREVTIGGDYAFVSRPPRPE